MNNVTIPEIAQMLLNARRMIIITHASPDGDCIGSAYALCHALPECRSFVVNDDTLSGRLAYITDGETDLSPTRIPSDFRPDLILTVDTATPELAGACGRLYAGKIDLRIDHHESDHDDARLRYVDPAMSSCGEIIYDIITEMGRLDIASAAPLYAAICADTGCFRYPGVTPMTYRKVATLLETGIDFADIARHMVAYKSPSEVRAIRTAYELLQLHRGGKVASILFTAQKKQELQLTDKDLSVLASLPKEIEGVELSVVIRQTDTDPHRFKLSMRSEPHIAANRICAHFGGGGHHCAAGAAVIADTPEQASETVLDTIFRYLDGEVLNDAPQLK